MSNKNLLITGDRIYKKKYVLINQNGVNEIINGIRTISEIAFPL
jgi:hypothetical protein